ncbi:MAG TPA: hypothetical protein VE093_28985 [Polyangiaceae bacterium]|nr:hypothetical protein [Polyangiaceae bacterium]
MTFSAMIQPKQGDALQLVSPAWRLPKTDARFAGEPVRWIRVSNTSTGSVDINAFADAAVRTFEATVKADDAKRLGFNEVEITLLELTPLPRRDSLRVFKRLTAGVPVQYVALRKIDPKGISSFVKRGSTLVSASGSIPVIVGVCFQDRVARDPAAWGALIAHAMAEAKAPKDDRDAWSAFQSNVLNPLVTEGAGAGRKIYLLDHVGRPLGRAKKDGFSVKVEIGAAAFNGTRIEDGVIKDDTDQAATLPSGQAAKVTVSLPNGGIPILAGVESKRGSLGAASATLALPTDERHVQLFDAGAWLTSRDPSAAGIQHYSTGNLVEPLIDGPAYFERLHDDIARVGAKGGVHVAGWALDAPIATSSGGPWLLKRGAKDSHILKVLENLKSRSAGFRLLLNRFADPGAIKEGNVGKTGAVALAALSGLAMGTKIIIPTDWSAVTGLLLAFVAYSILLNEKPEWIIGLLKAAVESSEASLARINAVFEGAATWSSYPAKMGDNPFVKTSPLKVKLFAGSLPLPLDFIDRFGVYHMKIVAIDAGAAASSPRYVAYLGGMDIVPDRIDTPLHRNASPFHDVQVRITGPAFLDVATTFDQRLTHDHASSATRKPAFSVPASVAAADDAGPHLVQITRTYFAPQTPRWGSSAPGGEPFSFAKAGEKSTYETMLCAIAQARELIYIEDQYFTPNDAFMDALVKAADTAQALVITLPAVSEQMFGNERRLQVLDKLRQKWQSRLYAGAPIRRYRVRSPGLLSSAGRCRLAEDMSEGATKISVSPKARLPEPPFWAFINGELLFCSSWAGLRNSGSESVPDRDLKSVLDPDLKEDASGSLNVVRSGGAYKWSSSARSAKKGDAVTVVQLPSIYVHAKVLVVDDIFAGVGSTNINRRGFFHDGEIHAFTVPEHLKGDPRNPARILRARLWAEHLGLPPEMGLSLLADPISALPLFGRAWSSGSPWQPIGNITGAGTALDTSYAWGDGIAGNILTTALKATLESNKADIWSELIDPTSFSDPNRPTGVDDSNFDKKRGPGLT